MIDIVIEDDIFITTNENVVSSSIYIQSNNDFFPNNKWSDFVFPMLEEWKNNLIPINNLNNATVNLYFHDGPFWLKVKKNENRKLEIECMSDRTIRKSMLTIYCDYDEFLNCLYNAFKKFLKILYSNGMNKGKYSSVYKQTILSIKEMKAILKQ